MRTPIPETRTASRAPSGPTRKLTARSRPSTQSRRAVSISPAPSLEAAHTALANGAVSATAKAGRGFGSERTATTPTRWATSRIQINVTLGGGRYAPMLADRAGLNTGRLASDRHPFLWPRATPRRYGQNIDGEARRPRHRRDQVIARIRRAGRRPCPCPCRSARTRRQSHRCR